MKTIHLWLLTLPFLVLVSSAHATERFEFGMDFRTDLEWIKTENRFDDNKGDQTLLFKVQRAHFNLRGRYANDISYAMRVRWNREFDAQTDNTGAALEYWYVNHLFDPELQFRVGKQFIHQGGREGLHDPIDLYGTSLVGERVQDLYEVGFSAFYQLMQGHTLVAQAMNQTGGGSESQFELSYNLAWYGSLAEGMIEPIVQFGVFPHSEVLKRDDQLNKRETVRDQYNQYFSALGAKVQFDSMVMELDLLTHAVDQYTEIDDSGNVIEVNETNESSIVLLLKKEDHTLDYFIKWMNNSLEEDNQDDEDLKSSNQYQLGAEYYPHKGMQQYRVHLVANVEDVELVDTRYNEIKLSVGVSGKFQ